MNPSPAWTIPSSPGCQELVHKAHLSPVIPIYFWLPEEIWPTPFPTQAETFISRLGYDSWITQTYLRLRESGFNCHLTGQIPASGIIVVYREFLPYDFKPNPRPLLVCIKADKNPSPYAQLHIVHNAAEAQFPNFRVESIHRDRYLLTGDLHYIPHWPQPGLIPREPQRGDRITNVVYSGHPCNLDPALKTADWVDFLASLGMTW